MFLRLIFPSILVLVSLRSLHAAPPRLEFTRIVAHWTDYADKDYLSFIDECRPEVAQVGFYGAHFWSLAHTPHGQGYPAHFPKVGLAENGKFFQELNSELHKRKVKVVGHFNVKFLVGDPASKEGPRGFFKFYHDLWDEKELGPKPVKDPLDLLEKKADGTPLSNDMYSIGGMKEYWGCLNNPHWCAVLKAWTKAGIKRGVDGYVSNYFYRHDCHCSHCQKAFREYLAARFKPEQLKDQFAIADLGKHSFKEICSWHDPKESTPLRREMLRFSQIANKRAFDEVFVTYGRSLKPDLITAQWNHLGDFNQINGDERCLMPGDLWGKGEDYLWYSTGGAAYYTDLPNGFLGEGTLQSRFIQGAFDDKPFTLGKYESTRIRVAIAELIANGGAPMGFYTNFKDPMARKEIVRYYNFIEKNDLLFRARRHHAEVVLLFPRGKVHQGDVTAVEKFKQIGKALLDQHILFDVVPDDLATVEKLKGYQQIVKTTGDGKLGIDSGLSRFEAPQTVRVSASRPAKGNELDIHFVNYNRKEPMEKKSAGGGIKDENPIAVAGVKADVVLPAGDKPVRVLALTPESVEPVKVEFQVKEGRVQFTLPQFLVYCVARIELQ